MPAEIETAIVANVAAWWDREGEHVHDGLMTREQAWRLGGIDWGVDLVPIEFNGAPTGWNFVVRDSDDAILSKPLSDDYVPLQNERLMEYMSELVQDSDLMFESALSLKGGRVVAVCARRPEGVTIAGEEYHEYLTGANWHDGTRKARLFFSNVRTVCQNTLNAGLASARNVFKFIHVGSIERRMAEAREILEVGFAYNDELRTIGEGLALRKMSAQDFEAFLKQTMPDAKGTPDEIKAQTPAIIRTRDGIRRVYRDTPDLENLRGTAWGALQAVTAYNDHHRNFQSPDNRFEKVVLSRTETTQRALNYLLASA